MTDGDLQEYIKNLEQIVVRKQKTIEKMQGRFKRGIISRCLALSLIDPVLLIQRQISLLSEILEREEKHESSGIEEHQTKQVRNMLARLMESSSLVSEMLDNLKEASWTREKNRKEVHINTVISEWMDQIKFHPAYQSDIKINLHLNPYLPGIRMRTSEAFQIIHSLGVNALEALHNTSEGQISIRTDMTDRFIILEITDNGEGIEPEVEKDIFKPFYSTKISKHPHYYNAGLGLYTVLKTVKDFKGTITLESKPGRRTLFRVLLPIYNIDLDCKER